MKYEKGMIGWYVSNVYPKTTHAVEILNYQRVTSWYSVPGQAVTSYSYEVEFSPSRKEWLSEADLDQNFQVVVGSRSPAPRTASCECGSSSVGGARHSSYCPCYVL